MLTDKVAFITGGASGIGLSTAKRFAEEGARVVLTDLETQQDAGEEAVREIVSAGGSALFMACDVTQPDAVENALARAAETWGRLDIVLANAGINGVWAPIDELMPEEWDCTMGTNLRGTFLTLRYATPHLKKNGGGSMIIMSSVNGSRTFSTPGSSAYSTSKAGQVALMKMAALELGRHNIRVNAVCPGYIPTKIGKSTTQRNTETIRMKVEMPHGSPALQGGRGQAEDVADTCLYLASDLSRYVSGVEIYVDGGASLLR